MAIESLLIFIHTLINLNQSTGSQEAPKKPLTEQSIKKAPQAPQARGGWDGN